MKTQEVNEWLGRANTLLGNGRFDESLTELRSARAEASREGDLESQAFFSSILGSFLASRNRNVEALVEYAHAERCESSSASIKAAIANHFLLLGHLESAREKAKEVLALSNGMQCYEHAGFSLLGLAELALGNSKEASEAFAASADLARVSSLPASARDLRLAESLLNAGELADSCFFYLRGVRSRAQAEGDEVLAREIQEIEKRFTS